jgi:hypothetical protein
MSCNPARQEHDKAPELMHAKDRLVPIIDGRSLVGIVIRCDILQAFAFLNKPQSGEV